MSRTLEFARRFTVELRLGLDELRDVRGHETEGDVLASRSPRVRDILEPAAGGARPMTELSMSFAVVMLELDRNDVPTRSRASAAILGR
jgi:hypothetical protein